MALTSPTTPMLDATLVHEKIGSPNGSNATKPAVTLNIDQVRIVRLDEYKEAAACLAEAFREDTVVRYPGWSAALT